MLGTFTSPDPEVPVVKILICGEQRVGKSALLKSLHEKDFDDAYLPTTISDLTLKEVIINDEKPVALQLWDVGDTSGIGRSFLRGTRAVVLVVDMTSKQSIERLDFMYNSIMERAGFQDEMFTCAILGNKIDLIEENPETTNHEEILTLEELVKWTEKRRPQINMTKETTDTPCENGGQNVTSIDKVLPILPPPIDIYLVTAKDGDKVTKAFIKITETSLLYPYPKTQNNSGLYFYPLSRSISNSGDYGLSSVDTQKKTNMKTSRFSQKSYEKIQNDDVILLENPHDHASLLPPFYQHQLTSNIESATKPLKFRKTYQDKLHILSVNDMNRRLIAHSKQIQSIMSNAFNTVYTSPGISEQVMSPITPHSILISSPQQFSNNYFGINLNNEPKLSVKDSRVSVLTVEELTNDCITAKVIIAGAPCVGKTLLLNKYLESQSSKYSLLLPITPLKPDSESASQSVTNYNNNNNNNNHNKNIAIINNDKNDIDSIGNDNFKIENDSNIKQVSPNSIKCESIIRDNNTNYMKNYSDFSMTASPLMSPLMSTTSSSMCILPEEMILNNNETTETSIKKMNDITATATVNISSDSDNIAVINNVEDITDINCNKSTDNVNDISIKDSIQLEINENNYEPTLGVNFRETFLEINQQKIILNIWDMGGEPEMSQILSRSIYKYSDCLILIFDITNRSSFDVLDIYWDNYIKINELETNDEEEIHVEFEMNENNKEKRIKKEFPVLLVGNKCDCEDIDRKISYDEIMNWCTMKRKGNPIIYIECSALKNINVEDVFCQASQLIYDYYVVNDEEDLLEFEDDDDDYEEEGEEEEEGIKEYTDDNNDCHDRDEKVSLLHNKFDVKSNTWKYDDKESGDNGNNTIDSFLSQLFCHCI